MAQSTQEIYEKFYNRIRNFICSRLADKSQADDILHDIFLKIHMNLETVKDYHKIESWIFQIARNTINDYYRNRMRTVELSEDYPAENEVSDSMDGLDILSQGIRAIIGLLPPKYAESLILTSYQGLTQKELAEKLGLSLPGAKSRVQRGKKLFKDKLLEFCHFEFDRYGNVIDYRIKKCPVCFPKKNQ